MADRDLTGSQVRDHFRDEKGRYFPRPALQYSLLGSLDGIDAAKANTNDNTHLLSQLSIDFQAAIGHRHRCRRDRILDKKIHLLDLFRLDEICGREVWHFPGDLRWISFKVGKSADSSDPGAPGDQSIPILFNASPQWGNQAHACYDDPALFRCIHVLTDL